MDISEIDIDFEGAWIHGDQPVVEHGRIQGRFGFAPFRPREIKGLLMLRYIFADLELSLDTRNLDYINLFLVNFEGVKVAGSGTANGRLVYDLGEIEPGTKLQVISDDLRVNTLDFRISGSGDIGLLMDETSESPLALDFAFRDLEVQHDEDDMPMLNGETLLLQLSGSRQLALLEDEFDLERSLGLTIDKLNVPDLSRFQRFIPPKWPFVLYAGEGQLSGHASLGPNVLSVDLEINSDQADMGISRYRFGTNLAAALRLENPDISNQSVEVAGTYLRLSDSRLQREEGAVSQPWEASIKFSDGTLSLVSPQDKQGGMNAFDFLQLIDSKGVKNLLGDSSAELSFDAGVSSLAFLDVLLTGETPAKVRGDGRVDGVIMLSQGLPAVGTHVEIQSNSLGVTVMDYLAQGDGHIDLSVEEGGENPDWRLAVRLDDGKMRRLGDETPGIEAVQLLLDALVEDVSFEGGDRDFDLRFQVPSAVVPDMALFNGYLPPNAPLAFTGGTAQLALDLRLREDDAQGFVRLFGEAIDVTLEEQDIEADLLANLLVVGGTPRDMVFDLAGSTVTVDRVRVAGEKEAFDNDAWSASLVLERADATWQKPPVLDIEAQLIMSDSRPFIALMRNNGGPGWLERMLTVGEIRGTGLLTAENHRLRIPSAEVSSEDITVGMKALITEGEREGMIFMRWKALRALLKVQDGKKNVDVINVHKTYDNYTPPR